MTCPLSLVRRRPPPVLAIAVPEFLSPEQLFVISPVFGQ